MCFPRNGSPYSFETCTIVIGMPENLRVNGVWSSKYKEKWCFIPKCVLSETDHHTALKLVPLWLACLKTSGCKEFGHLNNMFYPKMCFVRTEWCFIPKCVLSEKWTDHHTALKLVPLWLACLKTSGCMEFGPLNTKRSDAFTIVIGPKPVFCQKQIIIQLWNLYHCDWHAWKPQGAWSLVL